MRPLDELQKDVRVRGSLVQHSTPSRQIPGSPARLLTGVMIQMHKLKNSFSANACVFYRLSVAR